MVDVMNEGERIKLLTIPQKNLHGAFFEGCFVICAELLHMAPEHLTASASASYAGDIYSFGVVAYQVFSKSFIQDCVDEEHKVLLFLFFFILPDPPLPLSHPRN